MSANNRRGHRGRSRENLLTSEVSFARKLLTYARRMRKEKTHAEQMLWQELRANQLGVRFRSQVVIGKYITDFACLHEKLIIEVDGEVHHSSEAVEADKQRTAELEFLGFRVVRFSNDRVYTDIWSVVAKIQSYLPEVQ